MQSDAEYLRGFALFMSELFVHMNQKESTSRFRVLGRAVRELLLTLLEHPTPGNVKCVCQILKVGFSNVKIVSKCLNIIYQMLSINAIIVVRILY